MINKEPKLKYLSFLAKKRFKAKREKDMMQTFL